MNDGWLEQIGNEEFSENDAKKFIAVLDALLVVLDDDDKVEAREVVVEKIMVAQHNINLIAKYAKEQK